MLRELLKNKEFLRIIKESLKKQEIQDIILFGSLIRGKEKARDIDLLILFVPSVKNVTNIMHEIRKKLEKISKKFHIIGKECNEIFDPSFLAREAILSEGFSMKQKKYIAESLGYKNLIIFRYDLKNMNKSKRMQFYFALHGRNKETGILKKNKCFKFSERIIICPIENSETIKTFLEHLKINYIEFPIIIPERVVKYNLK